MNDKRLIGEWAMFKRRMFVAGFCLLASLVFMILAIAFSKPMLMMMSFVWLILAWFGIMLATEIGSYSGNPRVRDASKRWRNT